MVDLAKSAIWYARHGWTVFPLRPQDLVAALDGLEATRYDGTLLLCDARSLCTLIVNPHNATILTAYKMKPVKFRRIFSKRKHS